MYCVFIHGPAAAGKLTVATALRARLGLPVFHNHLAVDAALSLFEFGSSGFVRLREAIWMAAFREAAESGRSFIFTFSPEASVPPAFVGAAVDVVKRAGGQVLFVALTCSETVIEERIEAASRSAFRKLTSVAEYRRLRLPADSNRYHDRNRYGFARGCGRTDSRAHGETASMKPWISDWQS
jgi:hypothetical protein